MRRNRFLQEISAARSKHEAREVVEQAQPELDRMRPATRERLLCRAADLISELPDD
jgi:hypothetical protein